MTQQPFESVAICVWAVCVPLFVVLLTNGMHKEKQSENAAVLST